MAKLFFFMPMILFFGVFALLVIGFFGIIAKLINKTKADVWAGTLREKKHNTKDVDDDGFHKTEHFYILYFDTDKGERRLGVAKQVYDSWEISDKAKKEKGKIWPAKII